MGGEGYCRACLDKQREIDRLTEQIKLLRDRLRYQERMAREEGPFGSSTPSSKIPLKADRAVSLEDRQARRGGAKPGHVGHGRSTAKESEADEVVVLEVAERTCPHCGVELEERRFEPRTVIDIPPPRTRTILYRLGARRCPRCRRHFRARPPAGVLPRALLGNQLLAHLAAQHYLFGVPLGRLEAQISIGYGTLVGALHRLARLLAAVPERLVLEYRASPVKHADETGWRNDGHNGYAWLFATATISIFRFHLRAPPPSHMRSSAPARFPASSSSTVTTATTRRPCRCSTATRICCARSRTAAGSLKTTPRSSSSSMPSPRCSLAPWRYGASPPAMTISAARPAL